MRVFKGFLSRAYKLCTEKYLQSEIDFLIDIFTENGHNRNTQTNIATEYLRNINKPKSNHQNNAKNIKSIIKLLWVPIFGPKLRKEFKKKDIKTVFTSGANLKSVLCQNKSKLIQDIKDRKIKESLEIKRSKCDSSKLNVNRDDGNFVKTNTWTPLLILILKVISNDLESVLRKSQKPMQSRYD